VEMGVSFYQHQMLCKEERGKSLVLNRSGYVAFRGQVGKEGFDFGSAHVFGVTLVVEEGVAFDPVDIGSL